MTQPNYTHISFLLDRSGSMGSIWQDALGGYTNFVQTQKAAPGKATFSFSVFDSEYTIVRTFADMQDVPDTIPTHIAPRGSTALLDALGRLVTETGAHLADLSEDERPSKVIVVIYTDGAENASREYTVDAIQTLIKQQETVYSWDFIFLASNIDAKATANQYGVQNLNRTASVHHKNLVGATVLTSQKIASYRSTGDASALSYTTQEQDALAADPTAAPSTVS